VIGIRDAPYNYDYAESEHGGLRVRLRDLEIVCRAAGALWIEAHAVLIVADLHLEKGSSFAVRGQMLPPYDTRETLMRLEAEVEVLSPRLLVFLGDTFHDAGGEDRLEACHHTQLESLALGRTVLWLAGNHDRASPRHLPGEIANVFSVAGLDLVHEPTETPSGLEIAGHLHPCAKVRGKAASVRRRCFVTDGERLILPAFGAYAGGLNIRDAAFEKLLRRRPLAAVLGKDRVHAIGWTSLERD
jgi:DNA ligase-associated metallophosphoesterase